MMQVNADLEILLDSGRMRILFEDSCVEGDVAELEDLVYKILQ